MNEMKIDEIYIDYKDKVERYIFGKVNNVHDAEDLVSSVFYKIYHNIDTFNNEKASRSTWIYSITRNTVIDYIRKNKEYCSPEIDRITDYSMFGRLEEEETLDELAKALTTLELKQRDLIILHYYDGKTLKEIANVFGMSYINAKIIHRKALGNLKKILSDK